MSQRVFFHSNTPKQRIEKAIFALRQGHGVIIFDNEARENETDLIFAAETMTVEQMAFTIRHCSGIICLCINETLKQKLNLPMMVQNNTSAYGTAFTVSIEAAQGVTTGVSAFDRITTIRAAIADNAKPADLRRPGHVFPLLAQEGGVLTRAGHTEATLDLVTLAGFKSAGVLCELMHDDGTMMRLPEALDFADKHHFVAITIEDLIAWRREENLPPEQPSMEEVKNLTLSKMNYDLAMTQE